MFQFAAEPLTRANVWEQLEMFGAVVVKQGRVLQVSLLDCHFAFRWLELPAGLEAFLAEAAEDAGEMRTWHIDVGAEHGEQSRWQRRADEQGLVYHPVADAEQAFEQHRELVQTGACERMLISLRMSDEAEALACDYIV